MTLLELLVVMAVVGLLMALGVRGVSWLRSSSLRDVTTDIAAVFRVTYNLATMSATHHRVVFDLDEQTYHIEACEGEVTLQRRDREEVAEEGEDRGQEADEALAGAGMPGLGGKGLPGLGGGLPGMPSLPGGLPPGLMPRPGAGGDIPSEILSAGSLEEATQLATNLAGGNVGGASCRPADADTFDSQGRGVERRIAKEDGLRITRMFVQHLEGEQRDGTVYVNFFPLGYAEKAAIEVADADGTTYTLLLHALTARVEFRSGRVEPEEHLLQRADGEEVEER